MTSRVPRARVIVLRHASAGHRQAWVGDDRLRPLDRKGRRQAKALAPLLEELGVRRVVSSPYRRCAETVTPLATALGIEVELDERLAEGRGAAARDLLTDDGVLACTHGDVADALTGEWLGKGKGVVLEQGRVPRRIRPPKTGAK